MNCNVDDELYIIFFLFPECTSLRLIHFLFYSSICQANRIIICELISKGKLRCFCISIELRNSIVIFPHLWDQNTNFYSHILHTEWMTNKNCKKIKRNCTPCELIVAHEANATVAKRIIFCFFFSFSVCVRSLRILITINSLR